MLKGMFNTAFILNQFMYHERWGLSAHVSWKNIIWESWFRGWKPLLLSQNWKGLILSRPMLAADMRPKSLWNFKTESSWPGLKSFTGFIIEITCAGDKCACIMAKSCITLEKCVSLIGRKYEPMDSVIQYTDALESQRSQSSIHALGKCVWRQG